MQRREILVISNVLVIFVCIVHMMSMYVHDCLVRLCVREAVLLE